MRKPVTFRFDRELLERARQQASADNRTLTNYVETAVLRALEHFESAAGDTGPLQPAMKTAQGETAK